MGTPEFAVPSLNLLAKHHEVVAIYSQPPRANGRGMSVKKTPIHNLAIKLKIPIFTPSTLKNDDTLSTFKTLKPDIVVVVAYGLILPSNYLEIPKYGCINGHASLLPRWRGAAPIQRAIEAGDKETGSCIMVMEKGMDTGPLILSNKITISEDDNAQTLHDKLSVLTSKSLIVAIKMYVEENFVPKKQDNLGVMYAKKIEKNDSIIDWSLSSGMIFNKIRALHISPGTYTIGQSGTLKIINANVIKQSHNLSPGTIIENNNTLIVACGKNTSLEIKKVQKPGKNIISIPAYLNGTKLNIGDKFGSSK
jgi:methionyl-tRNA formyltransferase